LSDFLFNLIIVSTVLWPLSDACYAHFAERLRRAQLDLHCRDRLTAEAYDELERGLTLVGASPLAKLLSSVPILQNISSRNPGRIYVCPI
jgi:hypothetical protein